ncbi:POLG alternative reading frame [Emydura macquarii macquarii]|uniref:POLG alternative reading frame n=1 Tax=Emydura macquarii macquarii TaxID=1129001 RepID=UPI00352B8712
MSAGRRPPARGGARPVLASPRTAPRAGPRSAPASARSRAPPAPKQEKGEGSCAGPAPCSQALISRSSPAAARWFSGPARPPSGPEPLSASLRACARLRPGPDTTTPGSPRAQPAEVVHVTQKRCGRGRSSRAGGATWGGSWSGGACGEGAGPWLPPGPAPPTPRYQPRPPGPGSRRGGRGRRQRLPPPPTERDPPCAGGPLGAGEEAGGRAGERDQCPGGEVPEPGVATAPEAGERATASDVWGRTHAGGFQGRHRSRGTMTSAGAAGGFQGHRVRASPQRAPPEAEVPRQPSLLRASLPPPPAWRLGFGRK